MDLELLPVGVGVGAACVFAVEASFSFPFPLPIFWALWLPNSSINSTMTRIQAMSKILQ